VKVHRNGLEYEWNDAFLSQAIKGNERAALSVKLKRSHVWTKRYYYYLLLTRINK